MSGFFDLIPKILDPPLIFVGWWGGGGSLVKPVNPLVIFLYNKVTYVHKYYDCDLINLKLYVYVPE